MKTKISQKFWVYQKWTLDTPIDLKFYVEQFFIRVLSHERQWRQPCVSRNLWLRNNAFRRGKHYGSNSCFLDKPHRKIHSYFSFINFSRLLNFFSKFPTNFFKIFQKVSHNHIKIDSKLLNFLKNFFIT